MFNNPFDLVRTMQNMETFVERYSGQLFDGLPKITKGVMVAQRLNHLLFFLLAKASRHSSTMHCFIRIDAE